MFSYGDHFRYKNKKACSRCVADRVGKRTCKLDNLRYDLCVGLVARPVLAIG